MCDRVQCAECAIELCRYVTERITDSPRWRFTCSALSPIDISVVADRTPRWSQAVGEVVVTGGTGTASFTATSAAHISTPPLGVAEGVDSHLQLIVSPHQQHLHIVLMR